MYEKNKKIYFDAIPNPSTLPKIEKKQMAKPTPLVDDLTNVV